MGPPQKKQHSWKASRSWGEEPKRASSSSAATKKQCSRKASRSCGEEPKRANSGCTHKIHTQVSQLVECSQKACELLICQGRSCRHRGQKGAAFSIGSEGSATHATQCWACNAVAVQQASQARQATYRQKSSSEACEASKNLMTHALTTPCFSLQRWRSAGAPSRAMLRAEWGPSTG